MLRETPNPKGSNTCYLSFKASMTARSANTIHNGDIMLYGSSTLVVFYKSFSSSYSYTRIGRVSQPDQLADILGQGNVQIEFSRD